MQQRVMIAIALSCDPALLIADNPTTALDVTIQIQILDLVKQLRDRLGMAVLWITHDLGRGGQLCDRVVIMYAGEVMEQGDVYGVLKHPRHPYTRRLITRLPKLGRPEQRLMPIEGRPPDPATSPWLLLRPALLKARPECTERAVPSPRRATDAPSAALPGRLRCHRQPPLIGQEPRQALPVRQGFCPGPGRRRARRRQHQLDIGQRRDGRAVGESGWWRPLPGG